MKIFLLPGQNIKNKDWIEEVEKEFKKDFSNTEVIYYSNWKSNEKNTNVELETEKLIKKINNCKTEYTIFAKSIGSLIFFNSIPKLKKHPKKVLIVGFAYTLGLEMNFNFKKLSKDLNFAIHIYQKEFDPAGNLENIKDIESEVIKINMYNSVSEPNNNHSYENINYISKLLKKTL